MDEHKSAKLKHQRSYKDDDREHKRSKRKHKHERDSTGKSERKKHRDKSSKRLEITDDDPEEDVWIEKNIDVDGQFVRTIKADLQTALFTQPVRSVASCSQNPHGPVVHSIENAFPEEFPG